jgi:hypothetical protein
MMPALRDEQARQETGGPSRYHDLRVGPPGDDTEARVAALEAMTTADLRIEWQRLYQTAPPTRLSRDLLARGVAYRIQEQAWGGLSPSTRRKLRSLSAGSGERGGSPAAPPIMLKPGTKLVREWHDHVHTVDVLADGFEYRGEHYRSLTRIARRITGAHWSGPLFFGISQRRRAVVADE